VAVSARNTPNRGGQKRKSSSGKKKKPWAALFWLAFVILLFGLYLFNRKAINNSIMIFRQAFVPRGVSGAPTPEPPLEPGNVIQVPPPQGAAGQPGISNTENPQSPVEPPPSVAATTQPPPTAPTQTGPGNAQPQSGQNPQATQAASDMRDRALYFIRIGSDGSVQRVRADRRLPATDSPLRDVIQALIAGPNAEERQGDLISLIPGGTRLLSVTIRGDTAYINFNEDFQYNIYGAEGYNGQLRQIVFTATEFPNVSDVQILIEGSRVDFIGENFWIGSPLSREMF